MPAKRLPPGSDLSEIAGLMGPLGGTLGMAAKLSPDDLADLTKLLGEPIRVGKRLLRLSSGDPAKNAGVVHADDGSRINTMLTDFLKLVRQYGEDTYEQFPEGAVVTARGIPAPKATIGPKGGLGPPSAPKRRLK